MYNRGDNIRVWAKFRDPDTDAFVNPTVVTLRVQAPDDTVTTYTGAQLTHPSVGYYYTLIPIPNAPASGGDWHYRWETSGTYTGAEPGSFTVESEEWPT